MQRMNGVLYSSHQKACVAQKGDRQARPGWRGMSACLLPMELSQILLVSCQDDSAGWELVSGIIMVQGRDCGSCSAVPLHCTKEGIALNLSGFSLFASQPGRAFCWLLVPHLRLLSTSVLLVTGGSALEASSLSPLS